MIRSLIFSLLLFITLGAQAQDRLEKEMVSFRDRELEIHNKAKDAIAQEREGTIKKLKNLLREASTRGNAEEVLRISEAIVLLEGGNTRTAEGLKLYLMGTLWTAKGENIFWFNENGDFCRDGRVMNVKYHSKNEMTIFWGSQGIRSRLSDDLAAIHELAGVKGTYRRVLTKDVNEH